MDKHEYLHPHEFGDGLKLMEFGSSGQGTMMALAVLLATSNGRGGGDFRGHDHHGFVGRWAGDRITIIGDYHEPTDAGGEDNPWQEGEQKWTDISIDVRGMLSLAGEVRTRA
jgi:hypothetical protein